MKWKNKIILALAVWLSAVSHLGYTQCLDSRNVSAGDAISVSTTGDNTTAPYETLYLLCDDMGNILDQNTTGLFSIDAAALAGDEFRVHVLNVNTTDLPAGVDATPSVTATTLAAITGGCSNADLASEYLCFRVSSCISTTPICVGDALVASTSGTATSGYTTKFILVDDAGWILAFNTTGDFTADLATAGVGDYQIWTLNENDADPCVPAPAVGDPAALVGTTSGCFDADYTTEWLCITVNAVPDLSAVPVINACPIATADITSAVTDANAAYIPTPTITYWSDAAATTPFTGDPAAVDASQSIWVQYANGTCTDIVEVVVTVNPCIVGCVASATICEGGNVSVSSTTPNTTYTTEMHIVDNATGLIVAVVPGVVSGTDVTADLTGNAALVCGAAYTIHFLNYNPLDMPDPMPTVGDDPSTIGSTTMGCYDADYTTEYVCLTVNCVPSADAPTDVTSCDSYTLPALTVGNYYTGAGGTGMMLNAGDAITSTQMIFVYAETGTTPNCTDENSFTVTINTTPNADAPTDVTSCDSYTLPALTVGNYYTGASGTGMMLNAGDAITSTQMIYVYAETGTTPNCTDENLFTVTINTTPSTDAPTDVTSCDSYTLPALTVGNYYTGAGGTGMMLNAGDAITSTQMIFVYAETGTTPNCTDENSFTVTINTTPNADAPTDVTSCDSYTLPALTVGNYYTGASGTGMMLNAGDAITSTQMIFVYAETGTTPNCTDENSFTVTINTTPSADAPTDVTSCDSYTLPALTVGNYYTGAGGTGMMLNAGDAITSTQMIYVYAETGTTPNCTDENSFTVTINTTPSADAPTDVSRCDSYTLPALTVGNYYTGAGGTGMMLNAGDAITSTQMIYVYAETGTTPNCTDENSFTVTINTTPNADAPTDVTSCDSYTLPALTVGNYYTGASGTGMMLNAGDAITSTQMIYVYAETGTTPNCTDENSFTVTINTTPSADAPTDVSRCDSYTLPALTVGNYYTGASGTGMMLNAGDAITSTQMIYVYAETGTAPNCTDENSFTVTINSTPTATLSGGGNFCAPQTGATVVLTGTAGATVTINGVDYVIEADGSNDLLLGVGTYSISNVSLAGCNNSGNGNAVVTSVCMGSLGDLVYADADNDGSPDLDEGIAGVTLTISEPFTDLNSNGTWDSGEPFEDQDGDAIWDQVWMTTTTSAGESYTDSNGNGMWDTGEPFTDTNLNDLYDGLGGYHFNYLPYGNYYVEMTPPAGYVVVGPSSITALVNSSAAFQLGVDFILPIEFMSFNALSNCNDVNIAWSVGNETDVLQYNIQRSTDGINWETVGSIESSHTATAQSYSYVDLYSALTETYYRVVAIGVAGETKATQVAVTKTECLDITQIHVFPNPTTGTLTYEVNSSYAGKVLVVVIDELGRTHIEQEVTLVRGLNTFNLDVSKLAQALYFTGVNGMTESKYVKFYKID